VILTKVRKEAGEGYKRGHLEKPREKKERTTEIGTLTGLGGGRERVDNFTTKEIGKWPKKEGLGNKIKQVICGQKHVRCESVEERLAL